MAFYLYSGVRQRPSGRHLRPNQTHRLLNSHYHCGGALSGVTGGDDVAASFAVGQFQLPFPPGWMAVMSQGPHSEEA